MAGLRLTTLLKLAALVTFVLAVQSLFFSPVTKSVEDFFTVSTTSAIISTQTIVDPKEVFRRLPNNHQQQSLLLGHFLECSDNDELLVFVHSRVADWERRINIRNTWGSRRLYDRTLARVFFVIGVSSQENSRQQLQWEQDIHGDLVQGDFTEDDSADSSFDDVKSVVWLTWSERQCPDVPLIFKTDADAFVDLVALTDNLGQDGTIVSNATLVCKVDVFDEVRVFCAGDSYLLSNETRSLLLEGYREESDYFHSFDSRAHFASGTLAPLVGVALTEVDGLVWTKGKRFSFAESPIMPDGSFFFWEEMLREHEMEPVPPVILANFSTTSYESYVLNSPDFCRITWPDLETLVVVHTKPSQTDFRRAIRQTWADQRLYPLVKMRPLFFLGRSPDPLVEQELRAESQLHGDLVQTDFLDTYKNLTFKAVSWMRWVEEFCPMVPNLVKSDDDIAIDVFKLKKYLDRMQRTLDMKKHNKFHCYYWRYGRIERNPHHKHYVPKSVFAARRYPAYCSGSAYILSPYISQVLLAEFRRDPSFLWVDDVFITGVLAKRAGVKHHSMASAYAFSKGSLSNEKTFKRMVFAHLSGPWSHAFRSALWEQILLKHGIRLLESGGYETLETTMATTVVTVSDKT